MHVYIQMYVPMYLLTHIHTYKHTHTYTYAHILIQIHAHIKYITLKYSITPTYDTYKPEMNTYDQHFLLYSSCGRSRSQCS